MSIFEQKNNSKLLGFILGGVVVVVGLVMAYLWLTGPKTDTRLQSQASPEAAVTATGQPAPMAVPLAEPAQPEEPQTLVDEQLLETPVSEQPSLAKEEIAKLDDIYQQLQDQQQLLKEQHSSANELIKLKEEQIKLLEAQLGQAPE